MMKPKNENKKVDAITSGQQKDDKSLENKSNTMSKQRQAKADHKGRRIAKQNVSSSEQTVECIIPTTQGSRDSLRKLEEFAEKAKLIKADIIQAIEKQSTIHNKDQLTDLSDLKRDLENLSSFKIDESQLKISGSSSSNDTEVIQISSQNTSDHDTKNIVTVKGPTSEMSAIFESDNTLTDALDKLCFKDNVREKSESNESHPVGVNDEQDSNINKSTDHCQVGDGFEPLYSQMDPDSKLMAVMSSLKTQFERPDDALEVICRKLVSVSDMNRSLRLKCDRLDVENHKLCIVRQKLESLCRELQKSNHFIRIDSLELIKAEQTKAREQTTKIQSTLSSVINLFDENQQRNMALRQENQDLQTRLKSLLDHCDNWEKSVDSSLRQRDIENRLLKTELVKGNLIQNQERQKSMVEKQAMMEVLTQMQEQRTRIEGQEAKLRSDLSNYASKYDECQAVITKGMSKFQVESKRMLGQIQQSKQDYKTLLSKYEAATRRMAKLLEDKQRSDRALGVAAKKIDTLEKLCRALRSNNQQQPLAQVVEISAITTGVDEVTVTSSPTPASRQETNDLRQDQTVEMINS